jgi:3-deoxy-manno-octulosonate cytidylyltransferase (CMP-KDO synthetase)
MSLPAAAIVIPARLASTRLPRKLLLRDTGKPLIQHTYEAARGSRLAAEVLVAADHEEIRAAVEAFGGRVVMTNPEAASGSDRLAEVAAARPDLELLVNVQGDEPEIDAAAVDSLIELLAGDASVDFATLATPIRDAGRLHNPNCVKVVCDGRMNAMYFSRSPIPFPREWDDALLQADPPLFLQHVGLYAYRRELLLQFPSLPPSPLEGVERLEQLRLLQAGRRCRVALSEHGVAGIDTAADYEAFVARHRAR